VTRLWQLLLGSVIASLLLLAVFWRGYVAAPRLVTGADEIVQLAMTPPSHPKLIWIVVDGMNADKATDPEVMPFLATRTAGAHGIARAGLLTMTGPAVLTMGTGQWATLREAVENFEPQPCPIDNIFARLHEAGRTVHLVGDGIWTHRYGEWATHTAPGIERGQHDTHESDTAAHKAALQSIQTNPDVLVVHYVGPDHVGHAHGTIGRDGPYGRRLTEIDADIRALVEAAAPDTAILVVSDHGMTDRGGHGGGEPGPRNAPFAFWGPGIAPAAGVAMEQTAIAPNLARYMGVPAPDIQAPTAGAVQTLRLTTIGLGIMLMSLLLVLLFRTLPPRPAVAVIAAAAACAALPWLRWWPPHDLVYAALIPIVVGLLYRRAAALIPAVLLCGAIVAARYGLDVRDYSPLVSHGLAAMVLVIGAALAIWAAWRRRPTWLVGALLVCGVSLFTWPQVLILLVVTALGAALSRSPALPEVDWRLAAIPLALTLLEAGAYLAFGKEYTFSSVQVALAYVGGQELNLGRAVVMVLLGEVLPWAVLIAWLASWAGPERLTPVLCAAAAPLSLRFALLVIVFPAENYWLVASSLPFMAITLCLLLALIPLMGLATAAVRP